MSNDQKGIIAISGGVSLILAISVAYILSAGWISVAAGMVVFMATAAALYKALSVFLPPKMSADDIAEIRRLTMVTQAYKSIGTILAACYNYDRSQTTIRQIKQILITVNSILEDKGLEDLKLIRLYEYLSDFSASFLYINQLETGELIADDSTEEIKEFIEDTIPDMVSTFKNLRISVHAGAVAMGQARGKALKAKTANDGMRRTTLDDIRKLSRN